MKLLSIFLTSLLLSSQAAYSPADPLGPDLGVKLKSIPEVIQWVHWNITYASDPQIWGRAEYWALPRETLNQTRGDCEDLCILAAKICVDSGIARPGVAIVHLVPGGEAHTYLIWLNQLYECENTYGAGVRPCVVEQIIAYEQLAEFSKNRNEAFAKIKSLLP